ncbi:hypothetical protein NW754_006383 [Fusarium falciforme]|nr:hypothetical protein NW754_006383 [Fusarium falciforme]
MTLHTKLDMVLVHDEVMMLPCGSGPFFWGIKSLCISFFPMTVRVTCSNRKNRQTRQPAHPPCADHATPISRRDEVLSLPFPVSHHRDTMPKKKSGVDAQARKWATNCTRAI